MRSSGSIGAIIAWRVVQALGASAGVVLGRSMVRDLFERERAAQMMSTLMTVMAIAPLVGPLLGGQLLELAGWRAIFWVLVGVGAITLLGVAASSETLPPARRSRAPLGQSLRGYSRLLRNRRLLAYAGAGGFFYAGMFAYIAGTPFAYITYYRLQPRLYGLLFGAGVVGMMGSNLVSGRLVVRLGGDRLLIWGTIMASVAGSIVAATTSTALGGLWGLAVPLFLFVAATGFIVANAISGALADFPSEAGAVSALIGAVQYGSGIFGSTLVGAFADGTPTPMAYTIAICAFGSAACASVLRAGLRRPPHSPAN